jgi:hypothetical protein
MSEDACTVDAAPLRASGNPGDRAGAISAGERAAWQRDGCFVRRGLAPERTLRGMLDRGVEIARSHAGGGDVAPALVVPEGKPGPRASAPEEELRAATVYHYSPAGTVDRNPRGPTYVNDWLPVHRGGRGVAA